MEHVLALENVYKSYGKNVALKGVSFTIEPGLKCGLFGPNGAGKSTIIKLLAGEELLNHGKIYYDGELYAPITPKSSLESHIATIHQNTPLFKSLNIFENIYLGNEKKPKVPSDYFGEIFSYFFDKIDQNKKLSEITNEERFYIHICKALLWEPKVLIMDEVTNLLSEGLRALIFDKINYLLSMGTTLLMVSHDLQELTSYCDKIIGLKKGLVQNVIDSRKRGGFSLKKINTMRKNCFGTSKTAILESIPDIEDNIELIRWEGMGIIGTGGTINLSLTKGQVLCIYDDYRSHEFLLSLMGLKSKSDGKLHIFGKTYEAWSPATFRTNKIIMLHDDPSIAGFHNLTLDQNIIFTRNKGTFAYGLLRKNVIERISEKATAKFDINPKVPNKLYRNFSGGNKQKINLAREFIFDSIPYAIIANNITKGLDEASKLILLEQISVITNQYNTAILFISNDKNECESLLGQSNWHNIESISFLSNRGNFCE